MTVNSPFFDRVRYHPKGLITIVYKYVLEYRKHIYYPTVLTLL